MRTLKIQIPPVGKTTERLWCSHQWEQRTWPKAPWPVVLSVIPLVVLLLVNVWGSEILGSLTSGNTGLYWLPPPTGCLFSEELEDHLAPWFSCCSSFIFELQDHRKSPPCLHWENLGQALISLIIMWWIISDAKTFPVWTGPEIWNMKIWDMKPESTAAHVYRLYVCILGVNKI